MNVVQPKRPVVRTVNGDVPPEQLGVCYAHEHLLIFPSLPTRLEPDFLLDDLDVMEREIQAFTAIGGRTLVDMMPVGLGRNPPGLRELSQRTSTHIVAATGFHKERYYDPGHWIYHYSAEQIADLFRAEIETGMDRWGYRGPLVDRDAARAGVIKAATDYYRWTRNTEKWFEAAALAHLTTGAPIATHTEHGVLAFEQVSRLTTLGVPPSSIIVGHIDKNPDPAVHTELAATGVFLQYDSPSRQKYQPDSVAVQLVAHAAEAGYADKILFGMDLARRSYYPGYSGGPGLTYLLARFIPRLRASGLGAIVPLLFEANPARAFAFTPVLAD